MKLIAVTDLEGKQLLEFELKPCKMYDDKRHVNQTCHNKFEHCWKTAYDGKGVENAVANCIKLYKGFEPHITGVFFEEKASS